MKLHEKRKIFSNNQMRSKAKKTEILKKFSLNQQNRGKKEK